MAMRSLLRGGGVRAAVLRGQPGVVQRVIASRTRDLHVARPVASSLWKRWFGTPEEKAAAKAEDAQKRQKLVQEMRDQFSDLKEFRDKRGKRAETGPGIIPAKSAQRCPNVVGLTASQQRFELATYLQQQQRPVVLMIGLRGSSKAFLQQYRRVAEQVGAPAVELVLLESRMHQWISGTIAKGLQRDAPKELWNQLVVVKDQVPLLRQELDLFSIYTGYVFLLDREGRVRWHAHGELTSSESESLILNVRTLQDQA